jgi:hypothetical protein
MGAQASQASNSMGAQASQASNSVDDTAIKEGRASFGSDPLGLKGSMGCCAARSKPSKDYPAHRRVQVPTCCFVFCFGCVFVYLCVPM